jgi:hypothetical protein
VWLPLPDVMMGAEIDGMIDAVFGVGIDKEMLVNCSEQDAVTMLSRT